MRARPSAVAILVVLLSASLPGAAEADPPGGEAVVITELHPDPSDGPEFIELVNVGAQAVSLAGWHLLDGAGDFELPDQSLPPRGLLVIWSGPGADDAAANQGGLTWTTARVWNNGGDTATLRDAAGRVVDALVYGPDGQAPPTKGDSLERGPDGAWRSDATPTPGRHGDSANADGGTIDGHVANVPPVLELSWPDVIAGGDPVVLEVRIADDNGDADIASWQLATGSDGPSATGHDAGNHRINLTAPPQGPWRITAEAIDAGGATTTGEWFVPVTAMAFDVRLPAGGISFPDLVPGATHVAATGQMQIHNPTHRTLTPHLDIAPLTSDAGGLIPMADNLRLIGAAGDVILYAGPLTPLSPLAAGANATYQFELLAIPVPLPAGAYGTSFAVVP